MKKLLIFLLILIVLLLGTGIFGISYYNKSLEPVEPGNTEDICIEIPEGAGGYDIVSILYDNGLIQNDTTAKIYLKLEELNSLQANTYILNRSLSVAEIFDIISTGDFNYISKMKFTVIEGTRLTEIAQKIADELGMSEDDFLDKWNDPSYLSQLMSKYWFLSDVIMKNGISYPLEGYLYPETYYITGEPTVESVTELCLDMMAEKLDERKDLISSMGYSVHDFLSLASIVQCESFSDEDRFKIAGVIVNRLNQGMKLECDTTVLYALNERHISVTYQDLEVDSAYNTYKYAGLPIGPICSVPDYAMDAVLNYDHNDYLFFFACEDGTVLFASTAQEHNQNINDNLWY